MGDEVVSPEEPEPTLLPDSMLPAAVQSAVSLKQTPHRLPKRKPIEGTDPFGSIPFPLLSQDAGAPQIRCEGCQKWLRVHEEVMTAYEHAQKLPFLCSYLLGEPCRSGMRQDSFAFPRRKRKLRLNVVSLRGRGAAAARLRDRGAV